MLNTVKYSCRCVAHALVRYGVRHVVVSPGSRNAPLIVALARTAGLECTSVIDERTAAFVALGMAVQTGRPVAMTCTSGSAALNYGPALAEAYYRNIPLIALTADRPEEWIDQDDSQTIRQAGALCAVVKGSYDLPVCRDNDEGLRRLCRRRVCDALMQALTPSRGPVHINIQIDEPIDSVDDDSADDFMFPEFVRPAEALPEDAVRALAEAISNAEKVLIVAGFMPPAAELARLLEAMPSNCAVLCEAQSNLRGQFVGNIDATLRAMTAREKTDLLSPDLVITLGGSLLSRMIKSELRSRKFAHWSIGTCDHCLDPLLNLTQRIDCTPGALFGRLVPLLSESKSNYREVWLRASKNAMQSSYEYLQSAPWSDYAAMGALLSALPPGTNLHLSNGTAVRYAQLFDCSAAGRVECNRGVSGIDGCTSTAIGASMTAESPTLLITGDMSAQYDLGALAVGGIPSTFRMVVLNNGGGGIFRFIKATRDLPEMERFLAADVKLPLRDIAAGFGFDYYEARNNAMLRAIMPRFFADGPQPSILNIVTPAQASAETIKKYFNP